MDARGRTTTRREGTSCACAGGGAGALTSGDGREGGLGATQPVLALQLRAEAGANFSFEVAVRDGADARRRLLFSSSFSEVRATPLHCQVPLRDLPRDEWVSLLLPLVELVPVCFASESVTYKSIDSIAIRGECWIRKVFTLRGDTQSQLRTDSRDGDGPHQAVVIPRECDFPPGVNAAAHTVIPTQDPAMYEADEDERRARTREVRKPIKVAFGRRVPSSTPRRERIRFAAAPAEAFDDAGDARWTHLDQIMSNLRVREDTNAVDDGQRSCTASSPSESYRSSQYSEDEAAFRPESEARVASQTESFRYEERQHRYSTVDLSDEDIENVDDYDDDSEDERDYDETDEDIRDEIDVDNFAERDQRDDDDSSDDPRDERVEFVDEKSSVNEDESDSDVASPVRSVDSPLSS